VMRCATTAPLVALAKRTSLDVQVKICFGGQGGSDADIDRSPL
jgi:hypothetical protein